MTEKLKTTAAGCQMRDMMFKNLTSHDKRRKVLWASETINEDGILTKIHKYVIYIIREVNREDIRPALKPHICVFKHRNTAEKTEKFHLRMKGGLYCLGKNKSYHVSFIHTLKIDLSPSPQQSLS